MKTTGTVEFRGYTIRKMSDGRWHAGTVQADGRWEEQGDRYGYSNLLTAKVQCDAHFGRL